MRGMGYKSVSTVATHVNGLIARGHLRKRTRSARSLEIVNPKIDSAKNTQVAKNEEKWLVDMISAAFDDYEKTADPKKLDNLYVLVGALHILGLSEASVAFRARLSSLIK